MLRPSTAILSLIEEEKKCRPGSKITVSRSTINQVLDYIEHLENQPKPHMTAFAEEKTTCLGYTVDEIAQLILFANAEGFLPEQMRKLQTTPIDTYELGAGIRVRMPKPVNFLRIATQTGSFQEVRMGDHEPTIPIEIIDDETISGFALAMARNFLNHYHKKKADRQAPK